MLFGSSSEWFVKSKFMGFLIINLFVYILKLLILNSFFTGVNEDFHSYLLTYLFIS